ncbi:hypothetical protein I2I11_16720 [Pontibacter sp. 172403-2]|uniref:DUF7684 family protein n=1 Tax=Pontibacter rufus TaxID=2791028 RepID=UPI0018AFADBC|nr:hypothetical protein [Pontibacter sp. 172403-2]MBF9254949.1 hypothetical protein [Pontibacter sp. 172403-2]
MKKLGKVNNKIIHYQRHNTSDNWAVEMPTENWLLMAISDDKTSTILDEIVRKSIDRDVCFVCTLGKQAEEFHDTFDEIIALRKADIEKAHLPDYDIMTTWHTDFEDGVWFATFLARDEEQEIKTVFCLDAGRERSEKRIAELIKKINKGWVPNDK